jgi:hypothetical protein
MVIFLKRTFPLIITFVVGLFMIGEFFVPHYEYRVWTASVLEWGLVLAAAAFVLGLLNIVQVNLPKVIRREKDWGYKLVLLVTLAVTLIAGFWGGEDRLRTPTAPTSGSTTRSTSRSAPRCSRSSRSSSRRPRSARSGRGTSRPRSSSAPPSS